MSEITPESIAVSVALVASMAAFRKRRLGPIRGYLLGYDVWAALIAIAWASTRALGLPLVHFWRMHLVAPSALGLLFISMWTFWRKRFWFLKGLVLFYGILGVLIASNEHLSYLSYLYELLHIDTPFLTPFILVACVFTLVCGALTNRRRDEIQPVLGSSGEERGPA